MRAAAIKLQRDRDGSVRCATKKNIRREFEKKPQCPVLPDRRSMRSAGRSSSGAVGPVFSFFRSIRVHAFGDRVAVDTERRRRVSDALLVSCVGFLNVKLLEFFERLVQHDVAVEHVFNYSFKAGADLHLLVLIQVWSLESGVWSLRFEIWNLEFVHASDSRFQTHRLSPVINS